MPLVIDHAAAIVGVLTGALFACDRKLDVFGTAALGLVAGYCGGVMRDICVGETPGIFLRGNFYASAALAGTCVFAVLAVIGCPQVVAGIACIVVVMFLWYLSVYFD